MADLSAVTVPVVMGVSVSVSMCISDFLNLHIVVVAIVARVAGGGGLEVEAEVV